MSLSLSVISKQNTVSIKWKTEKEKDVQMSTEAVFPLAPTISFIFCVKILFDFMHPLSRKQLPPELWSYCTLNKIFFQICYLQIWNSLKLAFYYNWHSWQSWSTTVTLNCINTWLLFLSYFIKNKPHWKNVSNEC